MMRPYGKTGRKNRRPAFGGNGGRSRQRQHDAGTTDRASAQSRDGAMVETEGPAMIATMNPSLVHVVLSPQGEIVIAFTDYHDAIAWTATKQRIEHGGAYRIQSIRLSTGSDVLRQPSHARPHSGSGA